MAWFFLEWRISSGRCIGLQPSPVPPLQEGMRFRGGPRNGDPTCFFSPKFSRYMGWCGCGTSKTTLTPQKNGLQFPTKTQRWTDLRIPFTNFDERYVMMNMCCQGCQCFFFLPLKSGVFAQFVSTSTDLAGNACILGSCLAIVQM